MKHVVDEYKAAHPYLMETAQVPYYDKQHSPPLPGQQVTLAPLSASPVLSQDQKCGSMQGAHFAPEPRHSTPRQFQHYAPAATGHMPPAGQQYSLPPGQLPPGKPPPGHLPPGQSPSGQPPPGQPPPGQPPPGQPPLGQLLPGQLPLGQPPPKYDPTGQTAPQYTLSSGILGQTKRSANVI